jgi:uncharacterized protein YceK
MPSLKISALYAIIILALLSGCTQVVTAPIAIVGNAASITIDVAGSAVDAVSDSDDKEED